MSHSIYLGNLPEWATADDIRSWLDSSDLICDSIRVIRDFETQESKGYAFLEAPNEDEMKAIIERFHRAPIDGKLLQAKTAHPRAQKPARPKPSRRRSRPEGADNHSAGAASSTAKTSKNSDESVGTLGKALQKAL